MSENVAKPVMPPKPARSENAELWELLNYSKMRLEAGRRLRGARRAVLKAVLSGGMMPRPCCPSYRSRRSFPWV